jgi:uncharacterized Zn-binding protein involved in type VI secretion
MGLPAAKQGDQIVATDFHLVTILPGVPILFALPFTGVIDKRLSPDVNVMGRSAAVQGTTATNSPIHIPPVGTFRTPPHNQGEILTGSPTVFINGKPAARNTDIAKTCNDPFDLPRGRVIASATVFIG